MVLSKEKGEVLLLGQDPHTSGQAVNQVVQTTKEQPNSSYSYLKDGYKDLLAAGSIRRSNGHSLQVRMLTLDMSKKLFIEGITQHWTRPLREAVVSMQDSFQIWQDKAMPS